jgi:hypothetical protein
MWQYADASITPIACGKERKMTDTSNVETPPEVLTPEEGIEDLKRKLEAESNARKEAERRATAAEQTAKQATGEVEDVNLTLVVSAIDTVKRDTEALKAQYRAARESGDIDAELDAQERMSANAARLLQLENGKQAMEQKPKAPAFSDPVEQLASQLTPRSADWVRKHPEYVRDPRLNQKMLAAHNLAIADGIPADTDDYFESVETTLKIRQPTTDVVLSDAAEPTQRRSPPPSAPANRGANGGSRQTVIRLTSEEREMASMMGMTDEEYGLNKRALQQEGKLH